MLCMTNVSLKPPKIHLITLLMQRVFAPRGSVSGFYASEHAVLRCVDLYHQPDDQHSNGMEAPATLYPRYFSSLEARKLVVADEEDPRTAEFSTQYLYPLGNTSMLSVPIHAEGILIGALLL